MQCTCVYSVCYFFIGHYYFLLLLLLLLLLILYNTSVLMVCWHTKYYSKIWQLHATVVYHRLVCQSFQYLYYMHYNIIALYHFKTVSKYQYQIKLYQYITVFWQVLIKLLDFWLILMLLKYFLENNTHQCFKLYYMYWTIYITVLWHIRGNILIHLHTVSLQL